MLSLGVAQAAPRAVLLGTFVWQMDDRRFGGLSGLDLMPDALGFVAISDRGAVLTGRLRRDAAGRVTAVDGAQIYDLPPAPRFRGQPNMADAEGLALAPGGGFYVSFEMRPRIAFYPRPGAPPDWEVWPASFRGFEPNGGAEPLAIDTAGRLYTMSERAVKGAQGRIPVYRLDRERIAQPFWLERDSSWDPTGADFGPDGRLYLLERDFWPLVGFMTRIRRITLNGDQVVEDLVLFQSRAREHDNLEGIAAWRDAAGNMRLTAVADDNFMPLERTEIVDFLITE